MGKKKKTTGLGCGAKCLQVILFIFNLIVWLTGGCMIGWGIYLAVEEPAKDIQEIMKGFSPEMWETAVGLIITVGLIVFFLGFLGCWGAQKMSTCLLCLYSTLLSVIFVMELTAGILVAVMEADIKKYLQNEMIEQVEKEYVNETESGLSHAWNYMQKELECCGAERYDDYQNSMFTANHPRPVPYTCCVYTNKKNDVIKDQDACMSEALYYNGTTFDNLNPKGCYSSLNDWINERSDIVYAVVFTIAAIQLTCIIFGFCLRSSIKNSQLV